MEGPVHRFARAEMQIFERYSMSPKRTGKILQ
jgi:hypothetical protein